MHDLKDSIEKDLKDSIEKDLKDSIEKSAADQAEKLILQASILAREVINKASDTAQDLIDAREEETTKILTNALREAFGEGVRTKRFIDVARIPMICKSIVDISESIKGINTKLDTKYVNNDQFAPVKNVVYGLVGLILSGVVGAIITLILKH